MRALGIGLAALLVASAARAGDRPELGPRARPAESHADPEKLACVAANEEAQSLEQDGRYLASRSRLLTCVRKTCPAPVRADCEQLLDRVEAGLGLITLSVKSTTGGAVAAATVSLDGDEPVPASGASLWVDPGDHEIDITAKGYAPSRVRIATTKGQKERLDVRLKLDAPAPRGEGTGGTSTLGWVAGGIGAGALLVGMTAGVIAIAKNNAADDHCYFPGKKCDAVGVEAGDAATSAATVSTIAWGVGLVGIAAGVWLILHQKAAL